MKNTARRTLKIYLTTAVWQKSGDHPDSLRQKFRQAGFQLVGTLMEADLIFIRDEADRALLPEPFQKTALTPAQITTLGQIAVSLLPIKTG